VRRVLPVGSTRVRSVGSFFVTFLLFISLLLTILSTRVRSSSSGAENVGLIRNLIEHVTQRYDVASVAEKREITAGIVDTIKRSSGQFLKDDRSGWVDLLLRL